VEGEGEEEVGEEEVGEEEAGEEEAGEEEDVGEDDEAARSPQASGDAKPTTSTPGPSRSQKHRHSGGSTRMAFKHQRTETSGSDAEGVSQNEDTTAIPGPKENPQNEDSTMDTGPEDDAQNKDTMANLAPEDETGGRRASHDADSGGDATSHGLGEEVGDSQTPCNEGGGGGSDGPAE